MDRNCSWVTTVASCWFLMLLKGPIFRGNALIYIKELYGFFFLFFLNRWPTFLPPRFLPQVPLSRAEELSCSLPDHTSQASGSDGPIHQKPVDQGVEEPQRWWARQTLWPVHATFSHPGDPCGLLSPVSHQHQRWCRSECHQWKLPETSTVMKNAALFATRIIYSGICKYYVLIFCFHGIGGEFYINAINEKHFSSLACDKSSIGVTSSLCNTVLDKCMQGLSSLLSS